MKLLHINSYYSDSKLYKNLYDRQIKQGLDIDVFVSVPENYVMPNRSFGDYTIVSKNHRKIDRYWYQYKQNKMLKDLKSNYDVNKYDLIHAHSLFTNGGMAYKLHKEYGTDYIVAVRNTDVNTFFKKMPHLRSYGIEIMKHAKKIIFISNTFKNQVLDQYIPGSFKDEFVEKAVTKPNGIDQFWIDNIFQKEDADLESKDINIIYVGKIMKIKNVPTIASACKILLNRGYRVKLTVVGQVLDESEFKKFKDEPFVSYKGFQPMEEIIKEYRLNDIFVMPSFGETFGLVYVEAMSQGLPVIYTKEQGFDGQFKEGEVGYHINPHSPEDVAEKMLLAFENRNDISKRATQRASYFNWDSMTADYYDLYENIVNLED